MSGCWLVESRRHVKPRVRYYKNIGSSKTRHFQLCTQTYSSFTFASLINRLQPLSIASGSDILQAPKHVIFRYASSSFTFVRTRNSMHAQFTHVQFNKREMTTKCIDAARRNAILEARKSVGTKEMVFDAQAQGVLHRNMGCCGEGEGGMYE